MNTVLVLVNIRFFWVNVRLLGHMYEYFLQMQLVAILIFGVNMRLF